MKTSEQINELASALAKAQGTFVNPERNRTVKVRMKSGGEYTFTYTTFDEIIEMARSALAANGLAVTQCVETQDEDVRVTTRLIHSSGQWIESVISGRATDMTFQSLGSAITYLKRYSYTAMLGIASDEDDDGVAGSGHTAEKSNRKPQARLPSGKPLKTEPTMQPQSFALTREESDYVGKMQMRVIDCPNVEAMHVLCEEIKHQSDAVKNALRKLCTTRMEVLTQEEANETSQQETATA